MPKKIVRVIKSSRDELLGKSYAVDLDAIPPTFEAIAPDESGQITLTPVPDLVPQGFTLDEGTPPILSVWTGKFRATGEVYAEMPS